MQSVGSAVPRESRPPAMQRRVATRVATTEEQIQKLDFVSELKQVAIKLHTKDQAKKGEQETTQKPFQKWVYTREGYMRFMVHSRRVYSVLEKIVESDDNYSLFRNTGLERVASLDHDIEWIAAEYDLAVPALADENPADVYCQFLEDLSMNNRPAFVCHLYNFYLAHTAGGRMIGKKVADTVLSGGYDRLAFYKYNSDLKGLVDNFKQMINTTAEEWTKEERDRSINETPECFKNAGSIMRTMFDEE